VEEKARRLVEVEIEEEMKRSYIDYAMSVIVGRALPDVRDGLKPVHRRILYAMYDMNMYPNRPYKKCARIVGEVLGKYHPHGDAAVYDALVRMAQDFSFRYPLIDGHGNFGSVDGDAPAAMRYTEARLSQMAMELLADIDKNTVDFVPNFDDSLQEPSVLPSRYPQLLVNGSSGIAVGMSTNIPPHNLKETINAVIALIDDPDIDIPSLMKHIKGPDFPTGGIIVGKKGIRDAYMTGRGSVRVRGKAEIEESSSGKTSIVITEIPYQVSKAKLAEKIAELVRDKHLTEIADVRDESDRDGMRLVVELKRGSIPQVVLNKLYKHTQLETAFGIIMLALVDGVPRVLNLKELLYYYLEHQRTVIRRRSEFELDKAEKRAHILEGLLIALANLDEVIALIRASKDPAEAKAGLMDRFGLSDEQAQAILDMRLQRLTQLEAVKIRDEHSELLKQIEYLRGVLADPKKIDGIIRDELAHIRDRYADPRRTVISASEKEIRIEDLIADEDVAVIITAAGYIKRIPLDAYRGQQRGGKGVTTADLKEDDYIAHLVVGTNHQNLLVFTDFGKVYRLKVYQIPQTSRTARGQAIVNLLPLQDGEKVVAAMIVNEFDKETESLNLMLATKNGLVKKTPLNDFASTRRDGLKAIILKEGDALRQVKLTTGKNDVILLTRDGMSIRFSEEQVRPMGRAAAGVKGITLSAGDELLDMVIVEEDESLFMITENGYGKRTAYKQFRPQNRGGKGLIAIKLVQKKGKLAAARGVKIDEEVLIVSAEGQAIRVPVNQVPSLGRAAQGVRVMNLRPGDKVSALAIVQ
jgi:DNA gyrase subunit A